MNHTHETNTTSYVGPEYIRREPLVFTLNDDEDSNLSAVTTRSITPTDLPPLPPSETLTGKRARISEPLSKLKGIPSVLVSDSKSNSDGEFIMMIFLTQCKEEGWDNSLKHGKFKSFVHNFCTTAFKRGFPLASYKADSPATLQKKISAALATIKSHSVPSHSSSDSENGEAIPSHLNSLIELYNECYSTRIVSNIVPSQASTNLTVSRQVLETLPSADDGSTERTATRSENMKGGRNVVQLDATKNVKGNSQPTRKISILPMTDVLNTHHSSMMSMINNYTNSRALSRQMERRENAVTEWQKQLLDATRDKDHEAIGLIKGFLQREVEELNKVRAQLDELTHK